MEWRLGWRLEWRLYKYKCKNGVFTYSANEGEKP
jgi:hypothetical protein